MTFAIALDLLVKYGPTALSWGQKLAAGIEAGRANEKLTQADWDELNRLANQTGEDIYKRAGLTLPPANP